MQHCAIDGMTATLPDQSKPVLTVLFATHNGAQWIGQMLDAYVLQDFTEPWQMIIVDNRSSDDTIAVIECYMDRLPITLLSETRVGKNIALNRGLAHVNAELIVLTDDDAPPHPGFLSAWSRLRNEFTTYDFFGGRVVAQFEMPPPPWIGRLMQASSAVFAQRNLPTGPVAADEIFGPNMCVRNRVFKSGLTFSEHIGPNGLDPNYPMGSETEFCKRVAAAGFRCMFYQAPAVGHLVRPNQMTFAYFKKVAFRAGRRDAIMDKELGKLTGNLWKDRPIRKHVPKWLQRALLRLRAVITLDPVERNFRWWRYNWWNGYMTEMRNLRRAG